MIVSFLIRAGLVKLYYAAACYSLLAERFSPPTTGPSLGHPNHRQPPLPSNFDRHIGQKTRVYMTM
jgi:hypothetical protein